MKKHFALFFFLISTLCINAQKPSFESNFEDKTLRLDYIFSAKDGNIEISLDGISKSPAWYGKRVNLLSDYFGADGKIEVKNVKDNSLIYVMSFSSLFQEWTRLGDSNKLSFENTFLVPFPKDSIRVDISIRKHNEEKFSNGFHCFISHVISPQDIFIQKKGEKRITPHTLIHKSSGDVKNSINVAILAEGYTKSEMDLFRSHAKTTCESILAHEPFAKYKDRFNFYAIESPSLDSGVSVPRRGEWKSTAFSSHFDTFHSDRYLTTRNLKDVHNVLAGIPYSHIIILANTNVYGGGGILNSYTLTTTSHPEFKPVVVHEFGHSFAGLADEYFYDGDTFDDTYPLDIEPWEKNITTLCNFENKWKSILEKGTPIPTPKEEQCKYKVSVIEGAGYSAKGIYRGAEDCRMRTNTAKEFCPACQKAIEEVIKYYTE